MSFKDYFSDVASTYRDFRPGYPAALFEFLANSSPSTNLAWDCATGNGQTAIMLARHFSRIVATDASAKQVEQAELGDVIDYRVERAEASSLEDRSVDLVTVSQALHWFDLRAFEKEVARVAVDDGLLAAWSYAILKSTPAVDAVIDRLYNGILGDYWTSERRIVERGYADIEFGFREIAVPAFDMSADWTLARMIGYLSTWSAVRHYEKQHGQNPVESVADELAEAWGETSSTIRVTWPLTVRVWRVRDTEQST